jgi:phage gpG-like protein
MWNMDFRAQWEWKGHRGNVSIFNQGVAALHAELIDWSKAFRQIINSVLTPYIEDQFTSEGVEGGQKWAPLTDATIKRRQIPNASILYQTGRLLHSFLGGADHEETIAPLKMTWGSRVPYALFHQTGTGTKLLDPTEKQPGGRGMPQRIIFWLKDSPAYLKTKEAVAHIITRRMYEASIEAGWKAFSPSERGEIPIGQVRAAGRTVLGF